MYARKQTNINRHKSWHTQTFGMIRKVYEAEAKEELQQKQLRERIAEREKEREKRYYSELAVSAGAERKKERLDFMYELSGPAKPSGGGMELVRAEELAPKADFDVGKEDNTPIPGLQELKSAKAMAVDLESKVREDPMLLMKQEELHRIQLRLADPRLEAARRAMREREQQRAEREERREARRQLKEQERARRKEKKRAKKEKKKKKKKKKKKRSKDSSSDSSSSSDSAESGSESQAAQAAPPAKRQAEPAAPAPPLKRKRGAPLTAEQQEERRREMERAAREWNRERGDAVAQATAKLRQEEEAVQKALESQDSGYLRQQRADALGQTLAQRVQAGRYFADKDAAFGR